MDEFERQVRNLIDKGYPKLAGISEAEFLKLVEPLRDKVPDTNKQDIEAGYLPFVIVVKSNLIRAEEMMKVTRFNNKEGITKLFPLESENFQVIEGMEIPEASIYLLIDVERGKEYVNITPEKAFKMIQLKKRFPLTIDEGIAVITQFPEFLVKNQCFSLLASRTGSDQRVPAIWINANKQANLGWCWERNPHTWLGSASVKTRIG